MRDKSLSKIKEAATALDVAYQLADDAESAAKMAHLGKKFHISDRTNSRHFKSLFRDNFDSAKSIEVYRKKLDADIWVYLFEVTGMREIMDVEEVQKFEKSLLDDVPEISVSNVSATFERLCGDAGTIFKRGLANAFSKLDRRFKSHDVFKLGSRIILTNVFSDYGGWNYGSRYREAIADVERVFAVLDGESPDMAGLVHAVDMSRGGWGAMQSECESRYFKIRGFKNGNAHLWFTRDDLVKKANKVLSEYYGEVLPDGCAADVHTESLKTRAGLPSTNLQFYATPPEVVERLFDGLYFSSDMRVLEPSAGTGDLVRPLLAKGVSVDAIEIHSKRFLEIEAIRSEKLQTLNANFLRIPAEPIYDRIVMNPPFFGTHWIEHIMHAFDFLKTDGGVLRAILPVTAQIGESKKHMAFRKWTDANNRGYRHTLFSPLPCQSFASSGTNINTVIFEITRR